MGQAANITYFTMQVQAQGGKETRAMVVGIEPGVAGLPGQPGHLVAGGIWCAATTRLWPM